MGKTLTALKSLDLTGKIIIPGDKSISHRSLLFGALAEGVTTIYGLLEGEDVLNTAQAMEAMGVTITRPDNLQVAVGRSTERLEKELQVAVGRSTERLEENKKPWVVQGVGQDGLKDPEHIIDLGNSGTSARLLMGVLAGQGIEASLCGDASLQKRPMGRVIKPLEEMGAHFICLGDDGKLPITLKSGSEVKPIRYELPVASAQVKSAIILAGLGLKGTTIVIEPIPTRDHTERMLEAFGANIDVKEEDGIRIISIEGKSSLKGQEIHVPADPSSAAFPVVAALLCPGSNITLPAIGVNPTRTGLYQTLIEMGADITFENKSVVAGEEVADLHVKSSNLKGVTVPPERAASMIDEYPVLAIAASCASGVTRMEGIGELRVKESDRLSKIAQGLKACGVDLEEGDDYLVIHGKGHPPKGGALIETSLDHRIAMSFLVLGGVTEDSITIDDVTPISTSFPDFIQIMKSIGFSFES